MAMIEKYADKRQELKAAGDRTALAKLPRDSNPNRRGFVIRRMVVQEGICESPY